MPSSTTQWISFVSVKNTLRFRAPVPSSAVYTSDTRAVLVQETTAARSRTEVTTSGPKRIPVSIAHAARAQATYG